MRSTRMLVTAALVGVVLGVGCFGGGGGTRRLQGAGSTFVDPIMQEWANQYEREKQVQVNYQSKGSGAGIKMMTGKEVDFGCSDAPLDDKQLAAAKEAGGEVLHIPLCMGAIVPAYNLPEAPDLTFSGQVLIDIYLGKIKKWNDPAIQALNRDKALPDRAIAPAYRSDSSGSTYILTDYFTKVNKQAWTPGRGTAIEWPAGVGIGRKGNDGVAGFVKETAGAIGYIELIYALKNKIPFAAVVNTAGKPVRADLQSVTAAAATAEIPDDLRYSITTAPGANAYPIAGTVWALVYANQPSDRAGLVTDFLRWATHDGQKATETLHYAPLPAALVKKIDAKLDAIVAK
ncbi:MAG: phosphate ABC transporter substrate-binding protein PstS [Gemmataceae bacterium]